MMIQGNYNPVESLKKKVTHQWNDKVEQQKLQNM